MKTIPFDQIEASVWDAVAAASDDAWLFHASDWIEIESAHFAARNLSFGVEAAGRIVAILPLYLATAAFGTAHGETLVHSGLHRYAGLAFAPGCDANTIDEAAKRTIQRVVDLAYGHRADRIQLGVQNLAPRSRTAARDHVPLWVADHGFQLGIGYGPHGVEPAPGYSVLAADQIVDLAPSEDVLFARLDEACRRAVRKAERAKLSFETTRDPGALTRFAALAARSAERTGETPPPNGYREDVIAKLGSRGKAKLCFAARESTDVAALFLLEDKRAVSFLAGVSDPGALALRPNDFVHWYAILDAKRTGATVYRFGPVFPEVPADWPIAKVSAFKGKFGARAYPMIVGSRFLNHEAAHRSIERVSAHMLTLASRKPAPTRPNPTGGAELVAHLLRVVGVPATTAPGTDDVRVVDAASATGWATAVAVAEAGRAAVVLSASHAAEYLPDIAFGDECKASSFGIFPDGQSLRSRHPFRPLTGDRATPVLRSAAGATAWAWLSIGRGGVLLVGTDLPGDLLLLRQGDPDKASARDLAERWGFAGERPNYLFEGLLDPLDPWDRPADRWIWAVRDALRKHAGIHPKPVLPFDAPGAVIVTGDDDQAPLADYRAQALKLGRLPVTYFLHPLARVEIESLDLDRPVEWELHPDALDAPDAYGAKLAEQSAWYESRVGRPPRLVRNHGFLNDGYWGHAAAWSEMGIAGSSNLPGLDGTVLNGSLLPGRLLLRGRLTDHWSLLTAFGDGVFFVLDWSDEECLAKIRDFGLRIVASGMPGLIVVNLHPANHEKARAMHEAAHRLVSDLGFAAMNFGAALDWFAARDRGEDPRPGDGIVAPYGQTRVDRGRVSAPERPAGSRGFLRGILGRARRAMGVGTQEGPR